MKKPISKSTKSPAPATKSAAPAAKPVPQAKPAISKIETAPAAKSAVSKIKTGIPAALVVKPVPPANMVTTITALIDVGYGNTLYVRGEGPGLSWEKGISLDSVADDKWTITLPESARPIVFKFLLNDITWSAGDDFTVAPGTSITLTPIF